MVSIEKDLSLPERRNAHNYGADEASLQNSWLHTSSAREEIHPAR